MGERLTEEEIVRHRDNFRKIAGWLGASETVAATCAGISMALDELLERRRAEEQEGQEGRKAEEQGP